MSRRPNRIRLRRASSLALRATLRDRLRSTKPNPIAKKRLNELFEAKCEKSVKWKSGRDNSAFVIRYFIYTGDALIKSFTKRECRISKWSAIEVPDGDIDQ